MLTLDWPQLDRVALARGHRVLATQAADLGAYSLERELALAGRGPSLIGRLI